MHRLIYASKPVNQVQKIPVTQELTHSISTGFEAKDKFQRQLPSQLNRARPTTNTASEGGGKVLPATLQGGLEQLTGLSMQDVRVHYNSSKPAQLRAHAYAQGSNIHLAPGQEQQLAHEAWHVVQQKQGRVKPTLQMKGIGVNTDARLEKEADHMAMQVMRPAYPAAFPKADRALPLRAKALQPRIAQLMLDDALLEAKEQQLEADFTDKASLINFLQNYDEPAPAAGVDKIRTAWNKGQRDFAQRVGFDEVWPEQESDDAREARAWASELAKVLSFDQLLETYNLKQVFAMVCTSESRAKQGQAMLYKFMAYHAASTTIANHVKGKSGSYLKELNIALSSALALQSEMPVTDQIFRDFNEMIEYPFEEIGKPVLIGALKQGIERLTASLKEYELPLVVVHYFLHDKGYLNATTKLTEAAAAKYKERSAKEETDSTGS